MSAACHSKSSMRDALTPETASRFSYSPPRKRMGKTSEPRGVIATALTNQPRCPREMPNPFARSAA
jgi:hypothetical protein